MTAAEFLALFPRRKKNSETDWHVPCPAHDDDPMHPDKFSLHVTETSDKLLLKCFAGCSADDVVRALRLQSADLFFRPQPSRDGAPAREAAPTLAAFAALKRLPVAGLEAEGWSDGPRGLCIPYRQRGGSIWRERHRVSLRQGAGFLWDAQKGRQLIPYGRHRLDDAIDHGELLLCEGESDAVTCWHHCVPALGLPGATQAAALASEDLAGIDRLWVMQEPDRGGVDFLCGIRNRLQALRWQGAARIIRLLGVKDLSELHVAEPDGFLAALDDAKAISEDLFAWLAPNEHADALPRPFAEPVGALLAREFPAVEVYIENILSSEGSGFIAGEEKLGKTYYALDEAKALALGIPVCGRFKVPVRRRVLFIEEEDSPRRTRLRLRALCRGRGFDPDDAAFHEDLSAWFRVSVWRGFKLDDQEWLDRLDAELTAFPADVVYIDVLRKVTNKDLNKADQASILLDSLDGLRRKHGCIFRVLAHFRKGQGIRWGRGSQEIGGSFVLGAWTEQAVFLEPVGRRGGGVTFDVQSKDGASGPGYLLRFESEGPAHDPVWVRLHLDDPKPGEAAGSKYADQVLGLLSTLPHEPSPDGSGVTVKALSEAIRKDQRIVRKTLAYLIEKGVCADNEAPSTKNRRYRCTDTVEHEKSAQQKKE